MARSDALLRLHETLVSRRDELRRRLGGELKDLCVKTTDTGDSADLAFDAGSDEVNSQIAEIESRELRQIERALKNLNQGKYGLCEGCQKKIPIARLTALPFSTTCISCQREMERYGEWHGSAGSASWEKVSDVEARFSQPRDMDISQLEMRVTDR